MFEVSDTGVSGYAVNPSYDASLSVSLSLSL